MSLLLFERFGVEGVFVQDAAVLSLYAVGRLTGCAVDCGYSKTDIAPVYEGLLRIQGIRRLPFGGRHLTSFLQQQLETSPDVSEQIKEEVATVYESQEAFETAMDETKIYTLPDGVALSVTEQQYGSIGEALFRPDMMSITGPGIAESIYNATYCQASDPIIMAAIDT